MYKKKLTPAATKDYLKLKCPADKIETKAYEVLERYYSVLQNVEQGFRSAVYMSCSHQRFQKEEQMNPA